MTNTGEKQNLLVELFVEELPPKALQNLGNVFSNVLFEQLKKKGLTTAQTVVTTYASPRRLAAHMTQVLAKAADEQVLQKLMPVSVGLDQNGAPTPALLKKLGALGADGADAAVVSQLERKNDGKNETLFYNSLVESVTLQAGLQQALDAAIAGLPIPKVMSYQLADGWTTVHFVRPVHALTALHGERIVPLSVLGLKAGRHTHGHRFEAQKDPIEIQTADTYADQLKTEGAVIASFTERREQIQNQLAQAASKVGGGVQPIEDMALLDEVTALVEQPNVLTCAFEKEFLDVPQECLILTMKANQKYFPLFNPEGKLTHQFLVVSNITPADPSAVIGGNERVVRPRLADAKFFYDQDRKKTLADRVPSYEKVVYHNKLGTLAQRVIRIRSIAQAIAHKLQADSQLLQQVDISAQLAKADLFSEMVGEFPELQGIMGRYYAVHDGLPQEVADAIEDHYKPRFAGDELPRNLTGLVVALADKLETLTGMFGIGNTPSGDKDPFALRRHALGVIRMLTERQLHLPISWLLETASASFSAGQNGVDAKFTDQSASVLQFVYERLAAMLREQGYKVQELDALLVMQPQYLDDFIQRLGAVRAFTLLPEAPALASANKRVSNILKKSEVIIIKPQVNTALLQDAAELALFKALEQARPVSDKAYESGDYTTALKELAVLKIPVDTFFDEVMVNAEDEALRHNRLNLLALLRSVMNRVADLSYLAQ